MDESKNKGGRPKLPPPPPPGELPDENSRLWCYPPAAIRLGEAHIKPDTRVWFEEKAGDVQIGRFYPDHPRWNLVENKKSRILNDQICGEIHMLARLAAGLPELPACAIRQMETKQVQADTAYRLLAAVRKVSTPERLEETLTLLADRQPGQYLKLVRDLARATYVPAGNEPIHQNADAKQLDVLIEGLVAEMKRREDEMKIISVNPQDVEFTDPSVAFMDRAKRIHDATGQIPTKSIGVAMRPEGESVNRLKHVVDVSEVYDDGW